MTKYKSLDFKKRVNMEQHIKLLEERNKKLKEELRISRFNRKQEIKKIKKIKAGTSAQRKDINIQKVNGAGYVEWKRIIDIVQEKIKSRNEAFTIKLKSPRREKDDFIKTFACMRIFERWFYQTLSLTKKLEYGQWVLENNTMVDLFAVCKVTVIPVAGGCNKQRDSETTTTERSFKIGRYKIETYNPISKKNNCGIKCLERLLNKPICGLAVTKLREKYDLKYNEIIPVDKMIEMYYKEGGTLRGTLIDKAKHLIIVDENYNLDICIDKYNYLLVVKNHYYVIIGAESDVVKETCPTKRGELYWDIETRMTGKYCMVGNTKSYYLKDAITMGYYRDYKSTEWKWFYFATNKEKSSVRQFLDWLIVQSHNGKQYNCVAHNCARFDNYFLVSEFTEYETLHCEMNLRGTSIIGLQFSNHMFKDSCCFMTASLDKLCKDYKVSASQSKQKSFIYNGRELSNMEVCFYKKELGFWGFMELEEKEPEFWALYKEYCLYDCISLSIIWSKFTKEANAVIEKMGSHLLRNCSVASCNTVGSLAKKLIDNINKKNPDFMEYKKFIGDDVKKYDFVCKFKRGGISHVNQPGKHLHSVVSFDICSQYPTSLVNMKIPAGNSEWIKKYDSSKVGYYLIKNMTWNCKYKFKPVAGVKESGVLDWANLTEEMYIDSFMIQYLKVNYGLLSFDVIDGLVSNRWILGSLLFGKYTHTLFHEKALQDDYKKKGSDEYNPAYREVIKLFLNSVTGKLVEDPSKYFTMEYTLDSKDENNKDLKTCNGVNILEAQKAKINDWVNAGVMVYSYSKRLLFEYIKCLPNNSDDVINIETDSIYFNKKNLGVFLENIKNYCGEYPVAIGNELGNVKMEYDTNKVSYFLGKKFYYIENSMKIKGCKLKTLDDDGKTINCFEPDYYEKIFNGESVSVEFGTMVKNLWGETYISAHRMKRTVRPMMEYFVWM